MNENNQMDQIPVDQHIWNLLNGNIDGELSADEQHELDRLLVNSDRVSELDKELRAITDLLDELPVVEVPHHLQNAIEQQVSLPVRHDAKQNSKSFFTDWLRAPWLQPGLALAAAVVLTLSIYEMDSKPISSKDAENLSGTMVKKQPPGMQGVLVDSVHFETSQVNGGAELRNQDELFTLDVQLNSEGPVEMVMDLTGSGLGFESATHAQETGNAVFIRDGEVRLTSLGDQHFTLKLNHTSGREQGTLLELNLFANEHLVQKAELIISGY